MNFKPGFVASGARCALIGSLAGLAALLTTTGFTPAQASEETLYVFKAKSDGATPSAGLVSDAEGALYGTTTLYGSTSGGCCGTAFKLTPPASGTGKWTITVLYDFGVDGFSPSGGLIFDSQGSLYGTTDAGGSSQNGSVFQLTPPASGTGKWKQIILHSFSADGAGGSTPSGNLVFDAHGALYGTTQAGGKTNSGTVFKLTPPASGKGPWPETVLYQFKGNKDLKDGIQPTGSLIFDKQGALYGMTTNGGRGASGTVFKLTPPASGDGPWAETVLHEFAFQPRKDGGNPSAGLVFDDQGALYGTTQLGYPSSPLGLVYGGTVFKLTPPPSGSGPWTEAILHSFTDNSQPLCTLVFDTHGALYGTANAGNYPDYGGGVFKLTPPASGVTGSWIMTVLHRFSSKENGHPRAGVIIGHDGALYGTESGGGPFINGAVFRLQLP